MRYFLILFLFATSCMRQDTKDTLVDVHNFTVRQTNQAKVSAWNTGVRTLRAATNALPKLDAALQEGKRVEE